MSYEQNTKLEEELSELEEEVTDRLKVYRQADLDADEAWKWRSTAKMALEEAEQNLKNFKTRMQHD